MRTPSVVAAALAAVTLACAGRGAPPPSPSATAAADAGAPCRGRRYAEVHNTLKERAYVSITASGGQVYYPDEPFAPDEVRRIILPEGARPVRAEASSEPWRVSRRGPVTTAQAVREGSTVPRSQVSTRLPLSSGCASA